MHRILAIYPFHLYQGGISHIFLSLCLPHLGNPIQIQGIAPSIAPSVDRSNLIRVLPRSRLWKWAAYHLGLSWRCNEWRFRQELQRFDAAYIWPANTLNVFKQARTQNKALFLERINCFTGKAKAILDDAYAKLKVAPNHDITASKIRIELAKTQLSDFIFCPSPLVKASFLEAGVPAEKLLLTSYGWSPERFPDLLSDSSDRSLNPPSNRSFTRPFTVVFVGRVCVRKGAHLLLEAFVRSGIKGKLVLCGQIEPVIQEVCKDLLQHPQVIHQPFTENISTVYRNADLFAFPTLEEGSPLVSYEAMAHQLPMLVSPMGAGEIVRDRMEGYVLPPHEIEAWAEAIRELAANPDRCRRFAQAARARAMDFTFDKVADRRARLMAQCLGSPSRAKELWQPI